MIAPQQLELLRLALDDDGLREDERLEVDGVAPPAPLVPGGRRSAVEAAQRPRARRGSRCWFVEGVTGWRWATPPPRADAVLSTERLVGIDEFDPSEGVCHVLSGTPLSELRERVAATGWELPLDPPGAGSTVGGCVAAASLGAPVLSGSEPPRDIVLGLEVALASGQRTRCGGRVVKNVTGYDLNKLYTGSFGALGVIEAAWLRLRPKPDRVASCQTSQLDVASACRLGIGGGSPGRRRGPQRSDRSTAGGLEAGGGACR